jgi:hypothetical protein
MRKCKNTNLTGNGTPEYSSSVYTVLFHVLLPKSSLRRKFPVINGTAVDKVCEEYFSGKKKSKGKVVPVL